MFICVSLFLLVSINMICNIVNSRSSLVIVLPLVMNVREKLNIDHDWHWMQTDDLNNFYQM